MCHQIHHSFLKKESLSEIFVAKTYNKIKYTTPCGLFNVHFNCLNINFIDLFIFWMIVQLVIDSFDVFLILTEFNGPTRFLKEFDERLSP
jgi:hypothetical protein